MNSERIVYRWYFKRPKAHLFIHISMVLSIAI